MRAPTSTPSRNEASRPEETTDQPNPAMLEKYERCNYCNTKLLFTHDLNLSYLEVIECSRCPGCGVSMAPKKFTLQ